MRHLSIEPTRSRVAWATLVPLFLYSWVPALAQPAPSGAGSIPPRAAPTSRSPTTSDIDLLLAEIREKDKGQLAVSEEDGRFLRVLVASSGARSALEIGGASGYSAIWMGLGLRDTGGRLVTLEYDAARARELAANIRRAGLDDIVTVVAGDAFAEIPKLIGRFDFVFLDAWKRDYLRFFELIVPRLEPGGVFVAHNVVNKRAQMEDFLGTVTRHPALWTAVVSPSGEGMSVSYKRR